MSEKKKEKSENVVDERIRDRYELKRRLGKGAYGIVWKATDLTNNETVAVKKIFDAFRNQTDAQRTFREIKFLLAFRNHPNVIRLRGLHKASNNKDIYLVFDYMESDLHHVIKKKNVLADIHHRYIMYQLLRATAYLHSGNVIHRDQKPSNILINSECRIKIADFGLARSLSRDDSYEDRAPLLTDYVATRWYRAPEILIAAKRYTKGVDMWSLGCILGEMVLGEPLFPGSCTVDQIERIMRVLPEPTHEEIESISAGYGKNLLEQKVPNKSSLKELLHYLDGHAYDLIEQLLVFDPKKRMTAVEALSHPFVREFVTGHETTLRREVASVPSDNVQLSVDEYRNKLYELIDSSRSMDLMSDKDRQQNSSGNSIRPRTNLKKPMSQNVSAYINARQKNSIAEKLKGITYVEDKSTNVDSQIITGDIINRAKNRIKTNMKVKEIVRKTQNKIEEQQPPKMIKRHQKLLPLRSPRQYEPFHHRFKYLDQKNEKASSESDSRKSNNGFNFLNLNQVLAQVEQTHGLKHSNQPDFLTYYQTLSRMLHKPNRICINH